MSGYAPLASGLSKSIPLQEILSPPPFRSCEEAGELEQVFKLLDARAVGPMVFSPYVALVAMPV